MSRRPIRLRRLAVLAAPLWSASALPLPANAQHRDEGNRVVRAAIAELADPQRAAAAAEVLQRVGRSAVPELVRLIEVPQRYVEPPETVLGALYVLGRMGPEATAAVDALRAALSDRDGLVREQAAWALGEVALHLSEPARLELVQALGGVAAGTLLQSRLLLGALPEPATVVEWLGSPRDHQVIAACLVLRPPGQQAIVREIGAARLLGLLRERLHEALPVLEVPWAAPPLAAAAAELAAACRELDAAAADLLVGRGLIRHWDALQRRRGLLLLGELGREPLPVRAEVLPLLFDGNAELRQLAAWRCGGLGRSGVFALLPLQFMASQDDDVGVRAAAASATEDVLRGSGDDAAWLRATLAAAAAPAALPGTRLPLWLELLAGAEWIDAKAAAALLPLPRAGEPVPAPLELAIARWFANTDPAHRALAAGWFARHGCRSLGDPEPALGAAARLAAVQDGVLVEALAWMRAGPSASAAELRALLGSGQARLVVRAAAELLRRGDPVQPPIDQLLDPSVRWPVLLRDAGNGSIWVLPGVDLTRPVRAMTRLLQFATGGQGIDLAVLDHYLPPGTIDPGSYLRQEPGRTAELAARIEDDVRWILQVPPGVAPP